MLGNDYILQNAVVRLRPIAESDVDRLLPIATDAQLWTYFVLRIEDRDDLERYVAEAIALHRAKERDTFVIETVQGDAAGSTAYGYLSAKDRRVEIGGSWLGRAYQHTGINKNVKYLLLSYAFDGLGMMRVEFKTDTLNRQSRKALFNIGATEEGVLRSHTVMPGGRRRDTIYYSILRDEWPELRRTVFAGCSEPEVSRFQSSASLPCATS
jgi:RimJ/RimL family protein N-acetyltransferase